MGVLVEICRKLREGTVLKFVSEIKAVEEWEREDVREVEPADEAIEEARSKLLVAKSSDESRVTLHPLNGIQGKRVARTTAGPRSLWSGMKKIRNCWGGSSRR